MRIMITGGAGYIGSHVAKHLLEARGHELCIVDNLSTGSLETLNALSRVGDFRFVNTDLSNENAMDRLFIKTPFDVIFHFAASIVVSESVQKPLDYYFNNAINTARLLKFALKYGVGKFIFSSTAAVYGEPSEIPASGVREDFPTSPINPYGMSKLMGEQMIQDIARANPDFKYVILRYFNVAGADMQGLIGQRFPNATHLIKIATECASKKRQEMSIYGEDYPTSDGTCVRDYIHVDDLARAHIDAMRYLEGNPSDIFNCGYGRGYSVKEVIGCVQKVSGVDFCIKSAPRREGDPAELIADSTKIRQKTGWNPQYDSLSTIIKSALAWERKNA